MFKVDFTNSTDIISGNILIHDEDFQNCSSPCVSWDSDINGFVPDDWGFLISLDNSGSELLRSSFGIKSKDNIVFHGANDIVAFLKVSLFNVEGKSWHGVSK